MILAEFLNRVKRFIYLCVNKLEALEKKIAFLAVGLYQKIDKDNPEKVESYRQKQLAHFYDSLQEYGLQKEGNPAPTSWMVDNVLRDYGGLYGRITESIFLKPFTLEECERYWIKRGFHLSRYEIALTYMVIGGVPYYMDSIRPVRSSRMFTRGFIQVPKNTSRSFVNLASGFME